MTDIAEIGFRVDTSQLEKAEQKLNRLPAAAAGVDQANIKMAKLAEAAGAATAAAATSAARAENLRAQAALKALNANKNATNEEKKALREIERRTAAVLAETKAEQARVTQLNKVATALRANNALEMASNRPTNRISNVASAGRVQDATPARDQMPNRFNTANIASQFQDIGVTAAMGMNPLQIALQQGTQLSAIMQSMQNPLKGLAVALRSVFNAVSLGTIAFVALIAALLQAVNWTKVTQAVLRGLADAFEVATPYVLGFAAVLALIYSPTIIAGLIAITVSMYNLGRAALVAGGQMALGWAIGLGPVGWAIGAIALVAAAFQAMGFDVIGYMRAAANGIIGAFVGAFNAVKATWKMFPAVMGDIVVSTVNIYLKKVEDLINGTIDMINGLVNALPESLRPKGGAITWKANIQVNNPWEGAAAKAGNIAAEEFGKAFKTDYVGKGIAAAKGLGKSAANGLRDMANGLGKDKDGKGAKEKKDPWEELLKGADRTIATLQAEQAAIGMTEQATARLKYETDLLNEAQQKNIKLTPEMRNQIGGLAEKMAELESQTKAMKDALEFGREMSRGFISDMRSGLSEGKTLWESFASSVVNALNKIIDKLLEASIDGLFGGSGLGGLSKGITGLLGAFGFGGGTESAIASSIAANPGIFGKGGAFQNGVQKFASGGIVNSATSFGMSGGGMGIMGEAGPEAIMPLHRGPDGSLGVKMNASQPANDNTQEKGGNTYVINAPGASKSDLESVKQAMFAMLGPGKIEARVINAQNRGVL